MYPVNLTLKQRKIFSKVTLTLGLTSTLTIA
jgi:hypothetical protein